VYKIGFFFFPRAVYLFRHKGTAEKKEKGMKHMDVEGLKENIYKKWDDEIVPVLKRYIEIPNQSPLYDPNWEANGYMQEAVTLFRKWAESQNIQGLGVEEMRLPGRTPVLLFEIPGTENQRVLLYGHLDKQPAMQGWDADKGAWKAVMQDDKLYGRGGADDGYAMFAALTAISALQQAGKSHPTCYLLIEASEESGSNDLPAYLERIEAKIGIPDQVICLDSGAGDFEAIWGTVSLRGVVGFELDVRIMKEGLHSGISGGVVPSWFDVVSQLWSRVVDPRTGRVRVPALHVEIPQQIREQIANTAAVLGDSFYDMYPLVPGAQPLGDSVESAILARTWEPALTIVGIDGVPSCAQGGNVNLPGVTVKFSMRTPPTLSAETAGSVLKEALEVNPPFGVEVNLRGLEGASGWVAPPLSETFSTIIEAASQTAFQKSAQFVGEGASIPFMGMLGERFPKAQFLITGVLGPRTNAHGPNEFLHIPMVKKLTHGLALILHRLSTL
jgi:acetylornithine deacetylase/succinyl-diaminopimelate desuccinylase-like protein